MFGLYFYYMMEEFRKLSNISITKLLNKIFKTYGVREMLETSLVTNKK